MGNKQGKGKKDKKDEKDDNDNQSTSQISSMFKIYKRRKHDVDKKIPPCICGRNLTKIKCHNCYNGSGVACDGCSQSIYPNAWVYHCSADKCAEHGNGYDLCVSCTYVTNIPASYFVTIPQEIMQEYHPYQTFLTPYKMQENIPSGWCPKDGYKYSMQHVIFQSTDARFFSYQVPFKSLTEYLLKQSLFIQMTEFNALDQSGSMMKNVKDDANQYVYGKAQEINNFPFLCAELRGFKHKINILTKKEHVALKQAMHLFAANDTDILDDYRHASVLGRGGGSIHDLIDPSKNLSTLWTVNERSIYNKNYQQWIPSVFRVSEDIKKCQLLSEIPNLNPYKYKNLYKMISQLFLKMFPMFENICRQKLREMSLNVIVKAQDYCLRKHEEYIGNIHREGLYENIVCGGIYYYDIDPVIMGGDLELTSLIKVRSERIGRTRMANTQAGVSEGVGIAFSNQIYHRVCKIFCNQDRSKENKIYHRKIITFFLLNPRDESIPNARTLVVNWKCHMIHMVKQWIVYDQVFEETINNNSDCKWLLDIISEYVVGGKKYIKDMVIKYRKCRKMYSNKASKYRKHEIESDGTRVYAPMSDSGYGSRVLCNTD